MPPKRRNAYAGHASGRKAGPMKHRNTPRGGVRNRVADLLDERDAEPNPPRKPTKGTK